MYTLPVATAIFNNTIKHIFGDDYLTNPRYVINNLKHFKDDSDVPYSIFYKGNIVIGEMNIVDQKGNTLYISPYFAIMAQENMYEINDDDDKLQDINISDDDEDLFSSDDTNSVDNYSEIGSIKNIIYKSGKKYSLYKDVIANIFYVHKTRKNTNIDNIDKPIFVFNWMPIVMNDEKLFVSFEDTFDFNFTNHFKITDCLHLNLAQVENYIQSSLIDVLSLLIKNKVIKYNYNEETYGLIDSDNIEHYERHYYIEIDEDMKNNIKTNLFVYKLNECKSFINTIYYNTLATIDDVHKIYENTSKNNNIIMNNLDKRISKYFNRNILIIENLMRETIKNKKIIQRISRNNNIIKLIIIDSLFEDKNYTITMDYFMLYIYINSIINLPPK